METSRPSVWLVSPAWRRFAVTRLALAQRAHLAVELAARGIDCRIVIVADDDNLTIAREHGFDTVELANDQGIGQKFNAGFQHAARHGADYFVHIGSDDWIHPDAFTPILEEHTGRGARPIITGRRMAFVDLLTGTISRTVIPGEYGVIPWIIPRELMARCDFAPIKPERNRGLDGFLVRGLRQAGPRPRWRFHDPHPVARVDFKSDVNINPYARLPDSLRRATSTDPWPILAERYPPHLVELARNTHFQLPGGPVPKMKTPEGRIISVSHAGVEALTSRGYSLVGGGDPPPNAAVKVDPTATEPPSKSATKADWVAYAETQGVEDADSLTKSELVERLGG